MIIFTFRVPLGYSPLYGDHGLRVPHELKKLFHTDHLTFFRTCVRQIGDRIFECELMHAVGERPNPLDTILVAGRIDQSMRLPMNVYLRISPHGVNEVDLEFLSEPMR